MLGRPVLSAAQGPDAHSPFLPPGGCGGQTTQRAHCQVQTAAQTPTVVACMLIVGLTQTQVAGRNADS